ncbi:metallophosphoesterase family protein [Streptomyces sp. NRRL B-1347]|uniref:metallophosphoesterase family protein n=1 Tax=Streptomyces sp. NRRL B-1347 TaxID=1476877 RepID=UPI0004C4C96D|nr:metallophosphoesterase [Streptomyces sp. NRRL B-1347]
MPQTPLAGNRNDNNRNAKRRTGRARWLVPAAATTALAATGGLLLWSPAGAAENDGIGRAAFSAVAVGDIAEQCTKSDSKCAHPKTAALVQQLNPDFVMTMGDNQYDDARLKDFQKYYATTWGAFKNKTKPVPGNHETYDPAGALKGYKSYFGSVAYPDGKSYYSFDKDNWHFIALDSNSFDDRAQIDWLKRDLAANGKKCVAAYFHHPLFSSGEHGNNPVSKPVWKLLQGAKTELVLGGHDHHYERFAPQNANGDADASNGIVEVIAGTGGANPYKIEEVQPHSQKRITNTYGVVKFDFADDGFSWKLIGTDGSTKDSSPAYSCR